MKVLTLLKSQTLFGGKSPPTSDFASAMLFGVKHAWLADNVVTCKSLALGPHWRSLHVSNFHPVGRWAWLQANVPAWLSRQAGLSSEGK